MSFAMYSTKISAQPKPPFGNFILTNSQACLWYITNTYSQEGCTAPTGFL